MWYTEPVAGVAGNEADCGTEAEEKELIPATTVLNAELAANDVTLLFTVQIGRAHV